MKRRDWSRLRDLYSGLSPSPLPLSSQLGEGVEGAFDVLILERSGNLHA